MVLLYFRSVALQPPPLLLGFWLALFLLSCSLLAEEPARPIEQIGTRRPFLQDATKVEPYQLRISGYYDDGSYRYLYLNNGTIWRYLNPQFSREAWLIGDEVVIGSSFGKGWTLKNKSYQGTTGLQFERLSRDQLPQIAKIDNGGGDLWLTDGSHWTIDWWSRLSGRTWRWRVGERLIISPLELLFGSYTHLLINIDQQMSEANAFLINR